MSAKMGDFKDDLDVVMSEVRALLKHWGLGAWTEYLLVRQSGKPESFVVLAHPSDRSDFADKMVAMHRTEATEGK